MSRIWACSVQVIRYEADDEGRSWARSVQVPTFYLLGDVQGIRTDEEAATVARQMFVDTGNPFENVYVNVAETSMGAHTSVVATDDTTLAHEIADAIVNADGYADDPDEMERRADERDRVEAIISGLIGEQVGLLETCERIAALERETSNHKMSVEKMTGMPYEKFVGDMRKLMCG